MRHILWVDSIAGVLVGLLGLSFLDWLSRLFALPHGLVLVMAVANLAYGVFSCSLAVRRRRPRRLVLLLIWANASWAVLCWLAVALLAREASWYGLAYIGGEGLFVAALAVLEWRARENLSIAAPAPATGVTAR